MKSWYYDTAKHSGVNYDVIALIQPYDENHSKFKTFSHDVLKTLCNFTTI
ncbi:MAG: hypothetical protein WHV26_02890 [Spirochaetota bacterium]